MGKDMRLINIYLKIHNKRDLTIDDLRYLAKYSPQCFEKTCKNVVYNIPEAKPVMEPVVSKAHHEQAKPKADLEQSNIESILENLKRLEADDFPATNIDADEVKSLLGNLYMELMYPHNDKDRFWDMPIKEEKSRFDRKA